MKHTSMDGKRDWTERSRIRARARISVEIERTFWIVVGFSVRAGAGKVDYLKCLSNLGREVWI